MKRTAALALTITLALAACGGDDDDKSATASSSTTATTATTAKPSTTASSAAQMLIPIADIAMTLTEVGMFDQPVDFAVRKGVPGFYVAEKSGRVQYLAAAGATAAEVLDITNDVATGNEQGLLGITFSPDGSKLYVYFTKADEDGRLEELTMGAGATEVTGDPRVLLDFEDHYSNHNGGGITFGPDGKLYMGLGDGGAGGDPDHHGQDPKALNGKLLRFDLADPENPERYAIGLRNPWRFSFDRENGDLWIGDVGQNEWEEIDRIPAGTPAGVNLGWNLLEGTHAFEGDASGVDLLAPVHEYGHDSGQSVVGGYVYRGSKIPQLQSTYLFADTYAGPIRALREDSGSYVEEDTSLEVPGGQPVSFGEDADGEVYVISLSGGVYRIDPA